MTFRATRTAVHPRDLRDRVWRRMLQYGLRFRVTT